MRKNNILYRRTWAMPSKNTFSIKPIKTFIKIHAGTEKPFDLFPYPYTEDALSRIKKIPDESIAVLLYDPVYSKLQKKISYQNKGTDLETDPHYHAQLERDIFRVIKPHGLCLKFAWNSKTLKGFEAIDGIIVPHGGQHNDTICTAYMKTQEKLI